MHSEVHLNKKKEEEVSSQKLLQTLSKAAKAEDCDIITQKWEMALREKSGIIRPK